MAGNFEKLTRCRLSGSENLETVLSLGEQALTGVFPSSPAEPVDVGPLELVWCKDSGLLQLGHTFDPVEMYGDNYGYRSGLNGSMVSHLEQKVKYLEKMAQLAEGDVVLDIGSNDCTTLNSYNTPGLVRVGIDPTGHKFRRYYPEDVLLVPDFFSAEKYDKLGVPNAKVVSSIAMFYDLDDPLQFAQNVESILADDGLWHFEQSYLPMMLRSNSYDTICHEHLEYYSLAAVNKIVEEANLKICDVSTNDINGGSFAVTARKKNCTSYADNDVVLDWMLAKEAADGINDINTYLEFSKRVKKHRDELTMLVRSLNASGKKVLGYGASTKGNVLLQYCGFSVNDIPAIAEVNEDKFGCFTPGTGIPICAEKEAHEMRPDYFLLLPWHFREGVLKRERKFLDSGGHFIIPFPEVKIV